MENWCQERKPTLWFCVLTAMCSRRWLLARDYKRQQTFAVIRRDACNRFSIRFATFCVHNLVQQHQFVDARELVEERTLRSSRIGVRARYPQLAHFVAEFRL